MSRLEMLAYKLADSTAISDIEVNCVEVECPESGGARAPTQDARFYDTNSAEAEDKEYVATALEYLELRGLLDRHPEKPHLVRFRSIN